MFKIYFDLLNVCNIIIIVNLQVLGKENLKTSGANFCHTVAYAQKHYDHKIYCFFFFFFYFIFDGKSHDTVYFRYQTIQFLNGSKI